MKKRILSLLLCVSLSLGMLAGCASGASSAAPAASGDASTPAASLGDTAAVGSDEAAEIYMFITQPEYSDAINALIDEYKTVKPNVTINYETTQNDYPTLLKAKINSGDLPDIFASTSGKEIEVYKEYSLDLSDQPLMETMLPAVADTMRDANGEGMYGIAIKGNYFGLIYNKAIFEEVGIAKAPETLTELRDTCEKLQAAGYTPFTSGMAEWWVFKHIFMPFMDIADEDVPALIRKFETGEAKMSDYPALNDNFFEFVDILKTYGDAKPLEADLAAEIAAFASGKAAMISGQGAWVEADILAIDPSIQIGFAGYPVSEDAADCKVVTGSDQALRVNKDSENKQAVLDFINWWYTSEYGMAWFVDVAGVVPPIATTQESTYEIIRQGNALVEANGSGVLSVIYSTDSFHTAFGEAMQAYVGGTTDKAATVAAIEAKWQQLDGPDA